ncbi:MAG TPA: hypothetical protein DCY88_25530 [Cyanobacteria bacterium UBA11372]|nr:hypothetical protein [Cyanobacteria bacterium UBA11372]
MNRSRLSDRLFEGIKRRLFASLSGRHFNIIWPKMTAQNEIRMKFIERDRHHHPFSDRVSQPKLLVNKHQCAFLIIKIILLLS